MKAVVIADDHGNFRSALKKALRKFEIVGEASDGNSALELVRAEKPDLILLDLKMPGPTDIELIRDIKLSHEGIKILVVTIRQSFEVANELIGAGADGYFLKDEGLQSLRSAISTVFGGGKFVSRQLLGEDEMLN